MPTIKLGVDAGDHVIVTINSRPDENDDWLDTTIKVVAGAFSGRVSASLVTCDFPRFRHELESLYNWLDDTATFSTMERQLEIVCTGNGRGGIEVTGTVEDRVVDGNALRFHFDIDQTFLPELIDQIRKIEDEYPNRLHPPFPQ